jgi:hypothetical protein
VHWSIVERVAIVNLELGGGPHKRAGYVSMDIHSWGGMTDIIADMGEEWPIDDNSVARIFSCHAIEHVSWRRLWHVIQACYRVLLPGGVCTHGWPEFGRIMAILPSMCDCVRTHDVFEGDPDCPRCHGKGRVHPAYIKASLCGSQDYEGDVHRNVIHEAEMVGLMQQAGFRIMGIRTDDINPIVCWVTGVKDGEGT